MPSFYLPFRSDWQELDHILASHSWKYSVRLEIFVDCNFGDPGVEDYCYDEWWKPDDLHEHFRKFLQYEGLREMNNMGRLLLEIKKSALIFFNTNPGLMNLHIGPIEFSVR